MHLLRTVARLAGVASLVLAGTGRIDAGHAASAHRTLVPSSLVVSWLSVDPKDANRIYLNAGDPIIDGCNKPPLQSTDDGSTWTALDRSFDAAVRSLGECDRIDAFIFSPNGYVYAPINAENRGSSGTPTMLVSRDGSHWVLAASSSKDGFAANSIAISAARPTRLYASVSWQSSPDSGSTCYAETSYSDDGGFNWRNEASTPLTALPSPSQYEISWVVADPRRADTYYANVLNCGSEDSAGSMVDTNGARRLINPTGLTSFSVTTDSHEPGMIVGSSSQSGIPADRRYLSGDQGHSWQIATCPGDLNGVCPAFVVDNVFGAGASYAFDNDGIHAFQHAGPSGARLAISDRLPVPFRQIVDVQAGVHAGDPVYLLARIPKGTDGTFVYRSTDAGQSWQLLPAGLPNVAPPSTAPGAQLVQATGHSVAAVFAPEYRALGLRITGYPLTEAYLDHGALVQIFEHLQLEARGAQITIGDIGRQVLRNHLAQHDPALRSEQPGTVRPAPIPDTPTQRYFPQTHHTLRGELLRFWEQHGGLAVFGAPLTEVVTGPNGDGSARTYQMQYLEHARLEIHPENRDTRFRIQLGLLGTESLLAKGWLVTQQ